MAYNFKKLSEVSIDNLTDKTNVIVEEDGVIKKVSNFFRQICDKIAKVDTVDKVSDEAHVLIEENGVIKKVAKKSVGETSEAILGKIASVDAVEEPSETANVLIEESGAVKKVPVVSVGSGIKTAIITDNWYDAVIAGATEPPAEDQVYRCSNMTYEEARAILVSGEPLDVFCKIMFDGPEPINLHAMVSYMPLYPFIVVAITALEVNSVLFWTADGISTEPPAGA